MNRLTKTLSADENIRVALNRGNSVLVQIDTAGFSGTIDFKSSIDGATWTNHPYIQPRATSPSRSVAQISHTTNTSVTLYQVLAPVTDVRIDVTRTAGTVTVTYREILTGGFQYPQTISTVADGTEAAPGLPFADDTDTGFWRPAANTVALSVNGAETVRWTTTGMTSKVKISIVPASGAAVFVADTAAGDEAALRFLEATVLKYYLRYDGGANLFSMWSTDIDGAGADGIIWQVADGSRQVAFLGTISVAGVTTWSAGTAITAGSYQVGRNADATNLMQLNVPTGASFELSINDVATVTATANILKMKAASGTAVVAVDCATGDEAIIRYMENGSLIYYAGYDGPNNYWKLWTTDSDGAGADADVFRIPDGQLTIDANTTWDANVFDYVCETCGKHSGDPFYCHGSMAPWHDDVALMQVALRRDPVALARLERLGVVRTYQDGKLFTSLTRVPWFLMSGMAQMYQRVRDLEAEVAALKAA